MITATQYQVIKQSTVCKHFTPEQFDVLAKQIVYRKIPRNQILFFEGDARDKLYLIWKGYAKIEQNDAMGNFIYIDFVKQGTMFPYGGIFTDETYHYTATAVTDMEVFYIPVGLYEQLLLQNMAQLKVVCQRLSAILRFHELKLRNMLTQNASERVVQALTVLLLDLVKEGDKLPFSLTTLELAKLSGTTRETTSKVLKKLEQERIISYNKKIIQYKKKEFFTQYMV